MSNIMNVNYMTRAYNQHQQKNAAKDQEKEDTRFADSVREKSEASAVSYTHLDVYKRQHIFRMMVISAKHGKLICRVPVMLLPENVWRQKMIVQT